MTVRVAPGTDRALVELVCGVLPVWFRHLEGSRHQSEAAVGQMLAAFGELEPRLAAKPDDAGSAHDLTEPVERLYQGFQYQDRISQMVALILQDMQRLQQALLQGDSSLDAALWLARLESAYVMADQHQHHGSASADGSDETTFF